MLNLVKTTRTYASIFGVIAICGGKEYQNLTSKKIFFTGTIYASKNKENKILLMRKVKIILSVVIPDFGGIVINTIPMILFLSLTNFFAGETQGIPLLVVAAILLMSLALFLIPSRLILIIARMLNMNLDEYGTFSVAIIGGLIGGSLFYFLILSHFSLNWLNILDYALLGVIQSTIVQFIYQFIPDNWKVQAAE